MTKIAMLGTGKIADNELAPAMRLARGAELWSVFSRSHERAREFAHRHRAASATPAYDNLDALLDDPALEAVIVATPDGLHAEQSIRAARAGKHVLTEKPMATTREEARAMVDACAKAEVKLAIAYHMRWHPGHRSLADQVRGGALGELRHMRVQWTFKSDDDRNWRAAPEVGRWWGLGAVGTHCLDQVRWFLCPSCGEVTDVRSVIGREVWAGPHDETAVLALKFDSGATAEICSSVLFDAPRRMEIYGADGYALCENTLGPSGSGAIWTDQGSQSFEPANPYVGEIEDFVDAIQSNRAPEVAGDEGLNNIDILLRAIGA